MMMIIKKKLFGAIKKHKMKFIFVLVKTKSSGKYFIIPSIEK